MYNVLVFPCGTEVGLELHNALKWSSYVNLFGASSVSSNHGKYVFRNYSEGLPFVGEEGFLDALNRYIEENRIDFLYPAHDEAVTWLAQHRDELSCHVVAPVYEACRICRSKSLTYRHLAAAVPIPRTYSAAKEVTDYPVFLKPDAGQGAHGTRVARCADDIAFYKAKDPSLLILEYLPGKEYTIDCFTDRNGTLRFAGGRERIRTVNGISVATKKVDNPRFPQYAAAISEALEMRGGWFFQLKERADGDLVLMEVAPRIAGGMAYYRVMGVNFPLLAIFDHAGTDVDISANEFPCEMDRALLSRYAVDIPYENVYVDLDDTIIFRNSVNPILVGFIYQCIGQNKKVYLLTKSANDVESTLKRYRLAGLFDAVYHLGPGEEKSRHISCSRSIFIDDSFVERKKMAQDKGIAVFDTNAIESLLQWKA